MFRNPNLRRIQLAWAGSITGQYAYTVVLAVYAYHHGGASAVGLLIVIRMVPAAIVAPFIAIVSDRGRRELVMLAADLIRAAAIGGSAALVLGGGPAGLVYALAAVVMTVGTVFHPAQAALLPSLARSPEELTAANISSSSIESVGSFAGPAIGGLLLAASSTGVVFLVTTATFLWSAIMVARLRPDREPTTARSETATAGSVGHEMFAGFRTIVAEPKLRLIVGLYGGQTIVAGALNVLTVVVALRLLAAGNAGVGYLNSATGVGGLIGAAVALVFAARGGLARSFGAGAVLWGAPLVVIGVWPNELVALAMLGALGLGNTLVDVGALTLLQRSVPDAVLARVFGVVQGFLIAMMAVGAIVVPVLISDFGPRAALIATGAFLPVLAALLWPRLSAIDREATAPVRALELLGAIPIFAPLPPQTIEQLAHRLREVRIPAGATIIRARDAGNDFFVVDEGDAEVLVDGSAKPIGAGDYFGEIALLRDVPRTATVRAVTDVTLLALDRDAFIGAVTGHAPSREAADTVIGERLATLRTGILPV